jgi:hypothetical protein
MTFIRRMLTNTVPNAVIRKFNMMATPTISMTDTFTSSTTTITTST